MRRYLGALLLGSMMLSPIVLRADKDDRREHERDRREAQRYYDRQNHDWHQWNDHEQQAYHRYYQDRNLQYRDWERANRRQQEEYWRWRHTHPDTVIFPPVR